MSKVIDNFLQLTKAVSPSEALYKFRQISNAPKYYLAPNYQLAFTLFNERYPDEVDADKWKKLRRGYDIIFNDVANEFRQTLELLVADTSSRIAYIKRIQNELHSGQWNFQQQQDLATYFLESDEFKALKQQIDSDLWNELNEIGYAVWHSSVYSKAADIMIESELQNENIPLGQLAWLYKKPDTATTKPTSTPPAETEQPNSDSPPQTNVHAVAAMCYYLERSGHTKFVKSRPVFIETEILTITKFKGYSKKSIETKWGSFAKDEKYRRLHKNQILDAIGLMQSIEKFNYDAAIKQAEADYSKAVSDNL